MKAGIIGSAIGVLRFAAAGLLILPAFALEVQDYGIEVRGAESMRWVDNDRLALIGLVHVPNRPITPYAGQRSGKLVILDTRTGKTDWHEEFFGRFCHDGENFTLSSIDDIYHPDKKSHEYRFWILSGVPGKLARKEVTREYLNNFDFTMTCKGTDQRRLPSGLEKARQSGRQFKPLKVEHGWVEMAIHSRRGIRANPTYPIKIYPPGATEEGGFPVSDIFRQHLGEGFSLWSPEYVSFKDAYFILLDYYQSVRPTGSPLGWWMFPDGRVEALVLANPLSQTWGNLVFTRSGNLLIRMSFTRKTHHEAGIYIDDVKGPMNLFSGRVQEKASVSPDGCKVAFGNDPRPDVAPGSERYILHMIDVCERNSK